MAWATAVGNPQNVPDYPVMFIDGSNFYVNSRPDFIQRIGKYSLTTGAVVTEPFDISPHDPDNMPGFYNIIGIHVYNNTIYVIDITSSPGNDGNTNRIYAIDSSGTVTILVDYNVTPSIILPYIRSTILHNGYLYLATENDAKIIKLSLTNPTTDYDNNWVVLVSNDPYMPVIPKSLSIYNGYMYLYGDQANIIYKVNMTTKEQTIVAELTPPGANIRSLLVHQNNIYVGTINYTTEDVEILRYSMNGSLVETFASISAGGLDSLIYMTADNTYVYLRRSANVYRFTLPASSPVICFKDGTLILTDKGYLPIEELRKGDLVKTLLDGYKPIYLIGKKEIYHPATTERGKDQLYIGTQAEIPWLKEDLIVTGSHCILVDDFKAGEKEETIQVLGKVYATDKKYRLPACVDKRFAVYKPEGNYTVYHLALEHDNRVMNYGIYANGLLVETCSKRCMEEYGKLEVIA